MILSSRLRSRLAAALALSIVAPLAACTVGPDYVRPTALTTPAFKEDQGWRPSQPMDHIDRGAWWSVFPDPQLDALEKRVAISNQNIAAAAAAYAQARALTAETRASLFPTITASGSERTSGTASKTGTVFTPGAGGASVASSGGGVTNNLSGSLGLSWAPDVWGRVRRQVEGANANAQAQAADLASAQLSYQAEVASDYFALQALDEQKTLLTDTIAGYQKALDLAQNKYKAGVSARADVITAQVQLQATQAQLVDIGVQRAQLEHAIAVLVGVPPAQLTVASAALSRNVPVPPTGLPSALLERRPDIAAAERSVDSANAQIGVAVAAYFPTINLTGSLGTNAADLGGLFSVSNSVWSIGPSLAETLIDFGARKAAVAAARATYDQRVAQYRQTVLAAFQAVEDQLAALRVYEQEQGLRTQTEASANLAEQLALNQYRAGQVDYTTVITAQAQALSARQNVLTLVRERLQASVSLIEALGGGWTTADLPKG